MSGKPGRSGRKSFVATPEQRNNVKILVGLGVPQAMICQLIGRASSGRPLPAPTADLCHSDHLKGGNEDRGDRRQSAARVPRYAHRKKLPLFGGASRWDHCAQHTSKTRQKCVDSAYCFDRLFTKPGVSVPEDLKWLDTSGRAAIFRSRHFSGSKQNNRRWP